MAQYQKLSNDNVDGLYNLISKYTLREKQGDLWSGQEP